MFCPLKLYLQHNLNKEIEDEMIVNKGIKDLRIDLQDITQRNIRKVKKDMEIPKIEEILSKQVEDYIDTTFEILKEHKTEELEKKEKKIKKQENINPDILNREIENIYNEYKEDLDKLEELRSDIIDETYFNIKLLALKTKKGMNLLDKNGEEITEMFFPTCMYSYLIRDVSLELIGNIDKIEVVPNPIDINSFYPTSHNHNSKTILFCGSIEKRKGIYTLAKAIPLVLDKCKDKNIKFSYFTKLMV